MHHHLHQEVSDPVGHQLDAPGDDPVDAGQDEDAVPHPENGEDLQQAGLCSEDRKVEVGLTLSFIMLRERIQRAPLVSCPPPLPYLW